MQNIRVTEGLSPDRLKDSLEVSPDKSTLEHADHTDAKSK